MKSAWANRPFGKTHEEQAIKNPKWKVMACVVQNKPYIKSTWVNWPHFLHLLSQECMQELPDNEQKTFVQFFFGPFWPILMRGFWDFNRRTQRCKLKCPNRRVFSTIDKKIQILENIFIFWVKNSKNRPNFTNIVQNLVT